MPRLTPEAAAQLWTWLDTSAHEVVVECVATPQGVRWGDLLSTPTAGCAPDQHRTAPWSMHTHPRACYERNRTYYGWPSGADYATFLDQAGIEHWVCALEGIYVLRSTPTTLARWARLSDAQKNALERDWDLASDDPTLTPTHALAAVRPRLRGWITVVLHPYTS